MSNEEGQISPDGGGYQYGVPHVILGARGAAFRARRGSPDPADNPTLFTETFGRTQWSDPVRGQETRAQQLFVLLF